MNRINKSQYAILGWLSKGGMSGYDLMQKMQKITSFYWSESNAQVYPLLKKLQKQGYVISQLDRKSGKRKRRIYAITQQGLNHLNIWLNTPPCPHPYREEMLLKMTLSEHLSQETLLSHLKVYTEQIESDQKKLNETLSYLEKEYVIKRDKQAFEKTCDYVKYQLEAKAYWAKQMLDETGSI